MKETKPNNIQAIISSDKEILDEIATKYKYDFAIYTTIFVACSIGLVVSLIYLEIEMVFILLLGCVMSIIPTIENLELITQRPMKIYNNGITLPIRPLKYILLKRDYFVNMKRIKLIDIKEYSNGIRYIKIYIRGWWKAQIISEKKTGEIFFDKLLDTIRDWGY